MGSRYYRQDDDRELDPPPVRVRCDDCGRTWETSQDALDEMDEETPRRCTRCTAQEVVLAWWPVSGTRH
jgi:hypothetical protein